MRWHHTYDLVCIGSGPAGQRATIQAAKLGKKVAVIEKQQCIGGGCIETGTIPSKTFVDELVHQMRKRDVTFRFGDAVEHIDVVQTPEPQGLVRLASSKHIVADQILF
jgi:pyruvate/2-oxoglutarate dehydrogenase complex dihydrolipoamide dehydrogenase (E3) component